MPHARKGARSSAPVDIKRLGRLVAFCTWVSYDWVEEVLLSLHNYVSFERKVDYLRLWISVCRSLFARPLVRGQTVRGLCDEMIDHFGAIPGDLRRYVQAILVSGGVDAWNYIASRLKSRPEEFGVEFFLFTMAAIDKRATAHFLDERPELPAAHCTIEQLVKLTEAVGECNHMVIDTLTGYWAAADAKLKHAILQTVLEHRWKEFCPFCMDRLDHEPALALRAHLAEVVAGLDDFDRVIGLLASREQREPALYYHLVEMCYHRLLENPAMLARVDDIGALRHFERARQRLYRAYRMLHAFGALAGRMHAHAVDSDEWQSGMHAFEAELRALRGRREAADELCAIFQYVSATRPPVKHNIFGRGREVFGDLHLLRHDDFAGPPRADSPEAWREALSDLAQRANKSIEIVRECYLFKEWFVRKAPFVLHEDIGELVETIRAGGECSFSPEALATSAMREEFRRAVRIFHECAKQGVYLTDALLERLARVSPGSLHDFIDQQLTHRRSMMTRGEIAYDPRNRFDSHLQFTTFAHIYRYGKESMHRPPIVYLWLRFLDSLAMARRRWDAAGGWPDLPRHPRMQTIAGPRLAHMYQRQVAEARECLAFIDAVYAAEKARGRRVRIIPNITYGLFCLAPVIKELHRKGVHISLAGISSRFCDDINISDYAFRQDSLFPVKPYLFSTASNYGTLNHDRALIVIDGTMEPVDRLDPHKIRLPKAHRGYVTHMAAVNYVRSRYGYGMEHPERDVASALGLSEHYIQNLIRTPRFKQLVDNLLLSFDAEELAAFQRRGGAGKTYYGFGQWNPDRLPALLGSRGDRATEIPCVAVEHVKAPMMIFVSMNGVFAPGKIPAYFDNSPEVEKPRIIAGPNGVWLDTGWPHSGKGIVIEFPEGENA
jgi:hypothetical protein